MDPSDTGDASISARDVGEQVLKYFWDLASLEEAARAVAANGLVAELKASQTTDSNVIRAETLSPTLVYGLKRLVRGLASGRQGARQGYALALTTLMTELPTLPATTVLDMLDKTLEVSGQAKGSEAHDQLLGRVFGYAAAIRAGHVKEEQLAARCATALIGIANKKSFLRELAANVLLELTDSLDLAAVAALVKHEEVGLKAWLCCPAPEAHPEALLLALRLWSKLPADMLADMSLLPIDVKPPPKDFFTNGQGSASAAAAAVFTQQHLQKLLPVLRSTSSSHPRLHSVWLTLLALLLPGFTAVKDAEAAAEHGSNSSKAAAMDKQLQALWNIIIEALFQSSHERKALGFQLFTILLTHLQPQDIHVVFSRSFLRCLMNNMTRGNTYLHSGAQRCVQRLAAFADKAKAVPGMQVALAVALQSVGNQGFDKLTKTNVVATLLKRLDESELKLYLKQLQKQFVKGSKGEAAQDDQDIEKIRQWAVEQMCGVAAIRTAPAAIKTEVLKFLALQAFFTVEKEAYSKGKPKELKLASQVESAVAPETRQLCAARLISLIDSASKTAAAPGPHGGAGGTAKAKSKKRKAAEMQATAAAATEAVQAARLESAYLTEVVAFVSKVQSVSGVRFAAELSDEVQGALNKLRDTEAVLTKHSTDESSGGHQQQVRALLALVGWLQLYLLADPASMELDVAADLQGVFAGAFSKAKDAQGEPAWMDVLVDILLSLLGRAGDALPFHPLREACEALFRAFAEQVTPQGFEDLIRVVQQTSEGSNEEEDEEVFEEDEEDEEDTLQDLGVEDREQADEDDASQASSADESSDESSDDEDAEAASTAEADDTEEEDFNDDQMFEMDSKIAAALKVMAKGGANARESREAMQNFKFRVIGLIEIYIKKVPSSPLLPSALTPLLTALTAACQQGGSPPLAIRIHALIMALTKGQAQVSGTSHAGAALPEGKEMAALLRRTLYLASRHKDKKVAGAAVMAFGYLLRTSVQSEGKPSVEAQAAAKAAVDDFFDKKKSRLHRKTFEDIMARSPQLGVAAVLPAVAQHAQQARNGFSRADALALLTSFLKKEQHKNTDTLHAFGDRGNLIAELAVSAIIGDIAQTSRQAESLKEICSCFEVLKKVYPEMTVKLLGSQQGQSVKAALSQALASGPKNKLEVQLKRLTSILAGSSAVKSSVKAAGTNFKEKKGDKKIKKQKVAAAKKVERKSKGKKSHSKGKEGV